MNAAVGTSSFTWNPSTGLDFLTWVLGQHCPHQHTWVKVPIRNWASHSPPLRFTAPPFVSLVSIDRQWWLCFKQPGRIPSHACVWTSSPEKLAGWLLGWPSSHKGIGGAGSRELLLWSIPLPTLIYASRVQFWTRMDLSCSCLVWWQYLMKRHFKTSSELVDPETRIISITKPLSKTSSEPQFT